MSAAELYERDFAEWAYRNAELLRSGHVAEADLENIAEEIEAMARRDRRALRRRLARIIQHLLKWQFQPDRRSASWKNTLLEQRDAVREILEESPSLRHGLEAVIQDAYAMGAEFAANDTQTSGIRFPAACPYTLNQLLDRRFLAG